MLLSLFVIFACVGMGGGAAALTGYPLYFGFLAGWVCLPPVVMIAIGGLKGGHGRLQSCEVGLDDTRGPVPLRSE